MLSVNVRRDGTGPDLSVPPAFRLCEQSCVFSTTLRVFARNECCLFLSSGMGEKLIELVRKCEELFDTSNKKYSDSVWEEKLWGKIGEELKKSVKFQCFFIANFEVTIILSSPKF